MVEQLFVVLMSSHFSLMSFLRIQIKNELTEYFLQAFLQFIFRRFNQQQQTDEIIPNSCKDKHG
jgi:hypothetical protein